MSLSFPNLGRSYDAVSRRIRFTGHDSTVEVPFFLEENATFVLYPRTKNTEDAILEVFDQAREPIFAAAATIYAPGQHRSFYTLVSSQFSRVATA